MDCWDGSDETGCGYKDLTRDERYANARPPPALVNFNVSPTSGDSMTITPLPDHSQPCPETHFQCSSDGYCLPVFLRCNGVNDCPGRVDEHTCNTFACPGFYRCRGSRVCLHVIDVCDSTYHCPQHDDELFCGMDVPEHCACYGLACTCNQSFEGRSYSQLRYLDAADSGLTQTDLSDYTMLVYLSLARCGIQSLDGFVFPNLHTLDVRQNSIVKFSSGDMANMSFLKNLLLAENPLKTVFYQGNDSSHGTHPVLRWLDISGVKMVALNSTVLSPFPNLRVLNMSNSDVRVVEEDAFHKVKKTQSA